MDTEDDPNAYLKFLNDSSTNYLLHNGENGLTDDLMISVEPIFTDINPGDWASEEGFPIVFSNSLVSQDGSTDNIKNTLVEEELFENSNQNEDNIELDESLTYTVSPELTENDDGTNIFIPNDLLLLNEETNITDAVLNNNQGNILVHSNGKTYAITYEAAEDVQNHENTAEFMEEAIEKQPEPVEDEVIQLLNADGTLTTFDRSLLNSVNNFDEDDLLENEEESQNDVKNIKPYSDFFTSVAANKCKVCSFLCESTSDMEAHLDATHPELLSAVIQKSLGEAKSLLNTVNKVLQTEEITMFLCSKCKKAYTSKELLKDHMVSEHELVFIKPETKTEEAEIVKLPIEEKKIEPPICPVPAEKEKVALQAQAASLIKKQQLEMKKVKCSIKGCTLRFANDDLREKHEKCHVNDSKNQFHCTVCKERFSIWRICNNHMWKCHKVDIGLISCPICDDIKSNSPVVVMRHIETHSSERPYLCNECGKSYKQLTQLRNHRVVHKSIDTLPNWSVTKQCEICDRFFANAKSLKKHVQSVHSKLKPYICTICGHQTSRKAMLQMHIRTHTGDKPHECQYCSYKTRDHNCLRKHMMRHYGDTKYSCPHCEYTSIQVTAYKNHLVHNHPGAGGTFDCFMCPYSTVNAGSYASHVKAHELNKKKESQTTSQTTVPNLQSLLKTSHSFAEDEETQNFFNFSEQVEDIIDTGGITIPAGFELQLVS